MALEENVSKIRAERLKAGHPPVPAKLQGVTKTRIRQVLQEIDKDSADLVDVVFALLDDHQPSWFSRASRSRRFCEGASTGHLACHVGILQRGGRKLDREGRDYWIRPLRAVGAIEAVTFDPRSQSFVHGHPVAKSSNSAYRLAEDFKAILQAPQSKWRSLLRDWIAEDVTRRRLELQAQLAKQSLSSADTKHASLIEDACRFYVPRFLPGYEVLYMDAGDGDRVPKEAKALLDEVGLELRLEDAMPDVLLVNRTLGAFWVIEAVTSDGEVDLHKVEQTKRFVHRSRPGAKIGFTTAFRTWKEAATRQARHRNLAPDSYLWIREDGSKHFHVESFQPEGSASR
jgi:hypothetical protein